MKRPGKRVSFGATGRDLYLDLPLSNVVLNYRPQGLIADMIFPIVEVGLQSGAIIEFSQADLWRIDDTKRSPGTEAKRISIGVSSQTYYCNNFALQMGVTIEDRTNASPVYVSRLFDGRGMIITDKLLLDWERRVALQVNSTSNVGSSSAVASVWTGTGADPLADINTAIDNVHFATGYRPNRVAMGVKAWNALRRHSTVRNVIFGTNNGGGYPNTRQVADLLEVERLDVAFGFVNTAEENIAKAVSAIWSSNALIYYAPQTPAVDRPSFAYSLRWAAPGIPSMQAERHPYDSKRKQDDIEVGYYQDELVVGKPFGFLLTGAA